MAGFPKTIKKDLMQLHHGVGRCGCADASKSVVFSIIIYPIILRVISIFNERLCTFFLRLL